MSAKNRTGVGICSPAWRAMIKEALRIDESTGKVSFHTGRNVGAGSCRRMVFGHRAGMSEAGAIAAAGEATVILGGCWRGKASGKPYSRAKS